MLPIDLNNRIRLSIYTHYLNSNQFQLFIEKIYSKLKVLHLDVGRWQKFLSQNVTMEN